MTKKQNNNHFKFLQICLIIYLDLIKSNIVSCKNLNNYESVSPLKEIIQTRPTLLNKSGQEIVYTRYIKKSPIKNLNNEYVEDIVEYFDTLLQPPKFGSAESDIIKFLENDHEYRKQISKLSNNKNCSTKVIEREISTTTPSLSPEAIYVTNYPQTVKTMRPIIKVEILPPNKNISKSTSMIYRPETPSNDVYYDDEITETTKSPAPTTTTTTTTAAATVKDSPIKLPDWFDGWSTIKTILVNTTTVRPTTSMKPPTTTQKKFFIEKTTTKQPFTSTTTPRSFKSTTNTTTTIKPTSNSIFSSFFSFSTTAKTTTTTTVSTTPTTTTTQAPIISTTNSFNKESPTEEEDDDDSENYDDENDNDENDNGKKNDIDENNNVDKKKENSNPTNEKSYDEYTNGEDTGNDEQLTQDKATTKNSLWSYWL